MPLDPPEHGFSWLTVPTNEAIDVTIAGEPHTWHTHWVVPAGHRRPQAIRCIQSEAAECDLCRRGHERRTRYVIPVLHEGQHRLLELGRVQYPALAVIHDVGPWIGARIRLCRERPHKNAPIHLRSVGIDKIEDHQVLDVENFVRGLGTEGLRILAEDIAPGPRIR